jgi:hypothetical protein
MASGLCHSQTASRRSSPVLNGAGELGCGAGSESRGMGATAMGWEMGLAGEGKRPGRPGGWSGAAK